MLGANLGVKTNFERCNLSVSLVKIVPRAQQEHIMLLKIGVIVLLFIVIYCLGSGLYYLVREGQGSRNLAKALTWRISLSLFVFMLLFVGYFFGWITPHALLPQGGL